jgi:CRP-like cAMP-binding protein
MATEQVDRRLVRDLEVFRSLPEGELDAILHLAVGRRIPAAAVVFDQGEPASEFFALVEGRLKVVQITPDGQQVVVRHVGPGDIFGIARALRRPDYPATALAVVDSLVLAWPAAKWEVLLSTSPAFAAATIQTMGQRLTDAHARIRELSTEEVERRVARALLRLVAQGGTVTPEGVTIAFPITRQDIAEMTGSTLHTVSRILSAWEGRGLVASARRKVTVCNAHRLREIAEQAG